MAAQHVEVEHGDYLISTRPELVDLDLVHRYLSEESYWAAGRSREVMAKAFAHSPLVIGAYVLDRTAGDGTLSVLGAQVGFARMVTDLATYAWLADVFVLPDHGGTGLGSALVRAIVEHPDVVDVKWQFLATRDAHGLYTKFGYTAIDDPNFFMHRRGPS